MPMLADRVDAVVGVDTHRDTHEAEIAEPTGAPIATQVISNHTSGYAELVAWIVDHAPGPRVVVAVEGTRSYGAGLTRALEAAGLTVIECEQPTRKARRGKGKSDAIDAHLAVLSALQLDVDRLPTPRADGDREALRMLLNAREELTTTGTGQTNRLKALLLGGDDTDRRLARGKLTIADLATLARRRPPRDATREQAVRHGELRRLAVALRDGRRELKTNRAQLERIVDDLAPGLTDRRGIGPVCAAQAIVSFSHPGRCRSDAAFAALGGISPLEASSGRTTRHFEPVGSRPPSPSATTNSLVAAPEDPAVRTPSTPSSTSTAGVVERCFNRLKQWRGIATRYDKTARNYRGGVLLASLVLWARA